MRNRYYNILNLFFIAIALYSCSDNDKVIDKISDDVYVKINLNVPRNSSTSNNNTRAITNSDETEISSLKILVFDNNNSLLYSAPVGEIKRTQEATFTHSVKVKLTKTVESVHLCVIANIPSMPALVKGQSKSEIFNNLKFDSDGKWNAKSSDNFKPFPMWGQSEPKSISSSSAFSTIPLLRSVASVDVVIPENSQAYSKFKIKRIFLYNANKKGFVVPNTSEEYMSNNVAKKAYVPQGTEVNPPIEYFIANAGKKSYTNEIYLAESANKLIANNTENTCLIIGGYYINGSEIPKETFYRADFASSDVDGNIAKMDILRNYKYKFQIDDIKGLGFATVEEALNSISMDIDVNVIMWNENLRNVKYDGQYVLSVDKEIIEAYTEEKDHTVKVKTSYPKGWTAKVTQGEGWLYLLDNTYNELTKITGTADVAHDMIVRTKDGNQMSSNERNGEITITAGRIIWKVKVKQIKQHEPKLTITRYYMGTGTGGEDLINDGDIINVNFTKNGTDLTGYTTSLLNQLKIKWNGDEDIYISSHGPKIVDLENRYVSASTLDLDINRDIVAPHSFEEPEITQILSFYTVKDNKPSRLLQTIRLIKGFYSVEAFSSERLNSESQISNGGFSKDNYNMDGGLKKFYLKVNAPFRIKITKNESKFDASKKVLAATDLNSARYKWIQQQQYEINQKEVTNDYIKGGIVDFSALNDANVEAVIGEVEFTIEATDPEKYFSTQKFRFILNSAVIENISNSYMLSSNDSPILIPLDRMMKYLYTTSGESTSVNFNNFIAKLIWTDNSLGINNNSNIKDLKVILGKLDNGNVIPEKSYLYVAPGTHSGNCLVGIKESNQNKYYWSWHIWNTPYKPDKSKFYMDRNLGALFTMYLDNSFDENGRLKETFAMYREGDADNIRRSNLATTNYHKSMGLLYQWGRKDPFLTEYNATSIALTDDLIDAAKDNPYYYTDQANDSNSITENNAKVRKTNSTTSLGNTINHPSIVYTGGFKYWISGVTEDEYIKYWGDTKTDFDPCPYGWKIATKSNMQEVYNHLTNDLTTHRIMGTTYNANCGFATNIDGQYLYFPISVFSQVGLGEFNYFKSLADGRMWTSTKPKNSDPWQLWISNFTSSSTGYYGNVGQLYSSDAALPIRCVRNNDEQ